MFFRKKKDHAKLIGDVGELSGLFMSAPDLKSFLQKTVDMIAEHMHSEVCSIYLYNEATDQLTLKATRGLNPEFIDNIHLKMGEGLTGLALKESRPINERNASQNPNFRYFPGLGEEKFESFLAVPIFRGTTRIGTMVIQNTKKDYFLEEDENVLRAITSQLANTIEMTRLILALEEEKTEQQDLSQSLEDLKLIKAKVGSPGSVYAPVMVFGRESQWDQYAKTEKFQDKTLEDFHKAVSHTEKQLERLQEEIEQKLSDVASLIFTAQILMLKDKSFIEAIENLIQEGVNPPKAVVQIVTTYIKRFMAIPNSYIQEKSQDVRDIGKRLVDNLIGKEYNPLNLEDKIIIAEDLLPSDILKLSSQKVKGIVLLSGGVTGHISILSQSLGDTLNDRR